MRLTHRARARAAEAPAPPALGFDLQGAAAQLLEEAAMPAAQRKGGLDILLGGVRQEASSVAVAEWAIDHGLGSPSQFVVHSALLLIMDALSLTRKWARRRCTCTRLHRRGLRSFAFAAGTRSAGARGRRGARSAH
jgi:hypothetical protein